MLFVASETYSADSQAELRSKLGLSKQRLFIVHVDLIVQKHFEICDWFSNSVPSNYNYSPHVALSKAFPYSATRFTVGSRSHKPRPGDSLIRYLVCLREKTLTVSHPRNDLRYLCSHFPIHFHHYSVRQLILSRWVVVVYFFISMLDLKAIIFPVRRKTIWLDLQINP